MAKQEKGVALTTQSSVPDALKAIDARIRALKHIQDSVYKTPGKVNMAGGVTMDIKEQTNVNELVKAFSGILARANAIDNANEALGIATAPVTKVDGGTAEEWKEDILLRKAIIEQKETLDNLTALKKEWEALMDKEDKKALLISKMEQFAAEGASAQ